MIAGMVADQMHESQGIAFTAGLLHDVGKIISEKNHLQIVYCKTLAEC